MEETFVFGKEELSCCWYRLPKINTYAFIFLVSVVAYINVSHPHWKGGWLSLLSQWCAAALDQVFEHQVQFFYYCTLWYNGDIGNKFVRMLLYEAVIHIIVKCIFDKLVTIYRTYISVKRSDESLWDLKRVVVFMNKIKSR